MKKENNSTKLTRAEIEALPVVGMIRNNWRQRFVTLYAADDPTRLYMVGVSFDGNLCVISLEDIGQNEAVAMDYWKHGNKIFMHD